MEPDKYQQAWQAQTSQERVMVDADLLYKEVQRNQLEFRATIFCRDLREVIVAVLLIPVWFILGAWISPPWTWWLGLPALVWVIGFFLVDRRRHPQTPSDPGEPLLNCVRNSLAQVEHQIWLLRNVFWWYLLPFTISILAFFFHVAWRISQDRLEFFGAGGVSLVFLLTMYAFIDYINQRAVRCDLEPRRRELCALLAGLGGSDSSEVRTSTNGAECAESTGVLRRWLMVTLSSVVLLVMIALSSEKFAPRDNEDVVPPANAPR